MESADVSFFNTLFSFLLLHRPCYGVAASTIHRTPKARIRFFRRFDRIYAGSDAVVEQARRAAPKLANLKRIYNCTDLPDHCPPPPKKVGGEGLLFTYVGRFVPDKGLEHLIKGFAEALRDWPRNRLLTIGPQTDTEGADSAFFARMQSYVKEHRLENSITLHPPIYERELLMRELAQADVVCVPTITGETFSMAILEAMSLARPILTSDFGPMPEAVEHLTTGFVSKVADSESICEGIKYFSSNVSRLSEMGRNAYEKATKEFSPEKIAKEYIQDITDLINNRSK